MAQTARVNAFTDELVTIITGYDASTNATAFRTLKEAARTNLRHHRFGRTNQFEIQQSLSNLLERLYVINNEPLGEALKARLDELEAHEIAERRVDVFAVVVKQPSREIRWKPEILSLLLCLADRPSEKSRVEDLERIRPRSVGVEKLTWGDIVGVEGVEKDRAWGVVEDGDSDDEDREFEEESEDEAEETGDSSVDGGEEGFDLSSLIIEANTRELDGLREAQKWRSADIARFAAPISELQAVREVLHILLGLPSLLFDYDTRTACLVPSRKYFVENLSSPGLEDILATFADYATQIGLLRDYIEARQRTSLLQRFSQCLGRHLIEFGEALSKIEQSLAKPSGPVIVSLLGLQVDLTLQCEFMIRLGVIVSAVKSEESKYSYKLLDLLFDDVCMLQAIGNDEEFQRTAKVLHECLAVYLEPVSQWMRSEGLSGPDELFIIERQDEDNLASFWGDAFHIQMSDDIPMAPRFLHSFIGTIFSAGKQLAFFEHLGVSPQSVVTTTSYQARLTLERTLDQDSTGLTPYATLLSNSLRIWLASEHTSTSSLVRDHLFYAAGLTRTLSALSTIYLSSGPSFHSFADAIFARLDKSATNSTTISDWANPLAIEDIARTAFAQVQEVETTRLTAQTVPSTVSISRRHKRLDSSNIRKHAIESLAAVQLHYALSPVLQNIIPPISLAIYTKTSTLLLQLLRPITGLSRLPLSDIPRSVLSLRQKVLQTLHTVLSHILIAGVAAVEVSMNEEMGRAESVDAVITAHARFVRRIERRCLVSKGVESVRETVLALCELGWSLVIKCRGGLVITNADSVEDESEDSGVEQEHIKGLASSSSQLDARTIRTIYEQFSTLISLVVAGLRTASRAGEGLDDNLNVVNGDGDGLGRVEETWNMLADELESGLQSRRRAR